MHLCGSVSEREDTGERRKGAEQRGGGSKKAHVRKRGMAGSRERERAGLRARGGSIWTAAS